jgi:hypothetical protein
MSSRGRVRRALMLGVLLPGMLAGAALVAGAIGAGVLDASLVNGRDVAASTASDGPEATQPPQDRFQHAKHAKLFPSCSTCHAGVVQSGQPVWPEPTRCAACHDGVVQPRVTWAPRTGPRAGNLRFTHDAHARAVIAKTPADSGLTKNCAACHNERNAPRMTVRNAVVEQCVGCHDATAPHVDLPSAACATCHVPLSDAPGLTSEDVARFPKPRSHNTPDFVFGGHGRQAKGPGPAGTPRAIAASCATCHAQNFCITCHVDAPESPPIQALAMDARSPSSARALTAPPSHASPAFLRTHGRDTRRSIATCATCHTQQSCTTCHVGVPPRAIAALSAGGPGRAPGVQQPRRAPASHTRDFAERHGAEASARQATCETCHVRAMCLDCHRPDGASQSGDALQSGNERQSEVERRSGFHPRAFLSRHPSSAYAREANCSDCHNPAQFCQSCHQQSGLVATSRVGQRGYHDAFRGFSLGHGQAARQTLESCASCHAERDCTACHSAVGGGFRFKPHGPGFNAERSRSKNPTLCVACHGRAIPTGR